MQTHSLHSTVNLGIPPECLIYVENQFDEAVNEKIVAFLEKHNKIGLFTFNIL
jgi:hypothetical protein